MYFYWFLGGGSCPSLPPPLAMPILLHLKEQKKRQDHKKVHHQCGQGSYISHTHREKKLFTPLPCSDGSEDGYTVLESNEMWAYLKMYVERRRGKASGNRSWSGRESRPLCIFYFWGDIYWELLEAPVGATGWNTDTYGCNVGDSCVRWQIGMWSPSQPRKVTTMFQYLWPLESLLTSYVGNSFIILSWGNNVNNVLLLKRLFLIVIIL